MPTYPEAAPRACPARVGHCPATLKAVLEDARKHGLLSADVGIDVSVSASAWMWDTALSCDMYAGVLRKVLASRSRHGVPGGLYGRRPRDRWPTGPICP